MLGRTLKTTFLSSLIFGAALVPTEDADAYIPKRQSIASRVARGHGKGAYVIEQDVQFRTGAEPLILRERWTIENGERMRLSVTAPQAAKGAEPIRFEVLYRDNKRLVTDIGTGVKTVPLAAEFLEGFFHERTGKVFLASLVRARIVPGSVMQEPPKLQKIEQIKHNPDPNVRLGRTAGVVAWIFGEPSPVEGKLNAQAWVEQDAFNIRRIRFPSEAEVAADRISAYSNGLRFPRERTVTWGNNQVTIRVVSVRAAVTANIARTLEPSVFTSSAKPGRLPELAQVREFYTRFR